MGNTTGPEIEGRNPLLRGARRVGIVGLVGGVLLQGCGARTALDSGASPDDRRCYEHFAHSGEGRPRTSLAASEDAVVLAGTFSGTLTFADHVLSSTDDNDIFIVRLDGECHVEWAQR